MSRSFNLADELRKSGVPTMDTAEQIEYIPLDKIDPDPENFYSLEGIDELAGNIELVGLQQPLRVRSGERGHVIVVSGHRRRAACMLIRDGGSDMFARGVPCIRERGDVSKEMQELRLIYANSATRVLSGAEISRQAERVTELLYRLQEQGVEFPGRMRDHVAAAVNTSKSRIGRLHAIREKLDKPLLKLFDKGTINETVAYALSQQPVETQRKICDQYIVPNRKLEHMPASFVTDYVDMAKKLAARKCKINKGGLCINQDKILEKCFDGTWSYKPCKHGTCCADCDQYLRCRSRCPLLDGKAKAERAAKSVESKNRKIAEEAQKAADIRTIEQAWARYDQALRLAGLTDKQLRSSLKKEERNYNEFEIYMPKERVAALLDFSCTDVKQSESFPYHYSFKIDNFTRLCRFADALGVSLDYLFLRDDVPNRQEADAAPVSTVGTKPTWQTGPVPGPGRYLCRVDMGDGGIHECTCEYRDGGAWSAFGGPLLDKMRVISWWPLPGKEA